MRQSHKSLSWRVFSLSTSGSSREADSISRSVVLSSDPMWKKDEKACSRIFLRRT